MENTCSALQNILFKSSKHISLHYTYGPVNYLVKQYSKPVPATQEVKGRAMKQTSNGKFQETKPVSGAAEIKLRLKCISSLLLRDTREELTLEARR